MMRKSSKPRIPAKRRAEKMAIWESYVDPVGFKFYGTYKKDREWKHFEFSVVVSRRMKRRAMYYWTRETVRKMKKGNKLPVQHYYHTYRGFPHLHRSGWEDIDGIVAYDVKHTAT